MWPDLGANDAILFRYVKYWNNTPNRRAIVSMAEFCGHSGQVGGLKRGFAGESVGFYGVIRPFIRPRSKGWQAEKRLNLGYLIGL